MDFGVVKTVEVKGNPYEMGVLQGEYFRDEIRHAADTLLTLPSLRSLKPQWMPNAVFQYIAGKKVWKPFVRYMRYTPDVWMRFGGLVSGSGVSKEYAAFLHMGEVLLNRATYDVPTDACTGIAILPNMMGKTVVIKNFDYPPEIRQFNLLRKSIPNDGIPSIELTKTPVAIAHDGMNEEGLVVLYNYAASIYDSEDGPLLGALVQHVLNTAHNVDESVDIIMRYPKAPSSGIFLLADKKKAIAIEISPKRKMIRQPFDNLFVINTNHYQVPQMKDDQIPENAVFRSGPMKGRMILESSFARYDRGMKLLTRGVKTLDDVLAIARDHGESGIPSNNTICRHGEPSSATIVSAIFIPEDGVVYYRGGNPCEGPYGRITF